MMTTAEATSVALACLCECVLFFYELSLLQLVLQPSEGCSQAMLPNFCRGISLHSEVLLESFRHNLATVEWLLGHFVHLFVHTYCGTTVKKMKTGDRQIEWWDQGQRRQREVRWESQC